MSVDVRPLARDDISRLTALHNRAFADYPVPSSLDAAQLAFYMDETGVDPALSRLALVDGAAVSFCLGARRAGRASVRGEGTAPSHRRRGIGSLVLGETLAALAAAGASQVGLEVLAENEPALRLYRRSGFECRRRLVAYTLRRPPRPGVRARLSGRLSELDSQAALARLQAWGWDDAPWQLQLPSLHHIPALALDLRAVVIGRRRHGRFWLYALAVDPAHRGRGVARRALAALGAERISIPALLPEEWSGAHAFLRALGAVRERRHQWEMLREL